MSLVKDGYEVEGMTCASCANSVESMLSHVEGVKLASVNFAKASVLVEHVADWWRWRWFSACRCWA